LCFKIIEVVLPLEHPARDRWLTRSEAARVIWAAWRYREKQKGLKRADARASILPDLYWSRFTPERAPERYVVQLWSLHRAMDGSI
jgi:hypothetical protein